MASDKKQPLRFAALIRVSTEKQAKQGQSLATQKKELVDAVPRHGGNIVEWYGGQEHATEGWEKKEVERLLGDAAKGRFDAIIVAHTDRWSRDNAASKKGLEVFRTNGVRFFVASTEYDLFNPEHKFILGMSAEVGEFQAAQSNLKSLRNKIERAKLGHPACGSLPFGRTWDKKAKQWGMDESVKDMMEDVARRYIRGESLNELAREYGAGQSTMHERFKNCGPVWTQSFQSKRHNVAETVDTPVPPLLDEATIAAVQKRLASNKTFTHGHAKHKYLFARMIFCGHCKSVLYGQPGSGIRYYRHLGKEKGKKNCLGGMIVAEQIEDVVSRQLFDMFGNPEALKRAVREATPNLDEINAARKRLAQVDKELAKVMKGRENVIDLLGDGDYTKEEARRKLDELKKQMQSLEERRQQLIDELQGQLTPEEFDAVVKQITERVQANRASTKLWTKKQRINRDFTGMTWEEKRGLAQIVFSGKTSDGDRMGIYVYAIPDERKRRNYIIRGNLVSEAMGYFPMTPERMNATFGTDDDEGATTLSVVTKPAPWAPIPRQKYCRPYQSTRRAGG
jgi:site-specific DNA recombinase